MNQETTTGKPQFGLAALLSTMACISVFCASAIWVFQSNDLGTLSDIPFLIYPSIPMMGFGIIIVPFACVAIVLLMVAIFLRSEPRPLTALIFFGYVVLAVVMTSGWWDNSLRLLFATTLSSIAMLLETLGRKLPKPQVVAGALSICVSFGYSFSSCR